MFIDTHCHINDESYEGDDLGYVTRAREAGVEMMIQPDIDATERRSAFAVAEKYPGTVFQMIGLYPGSVTENWRDELDDMVSFLEEWKRRGHNVVAMGEIGLDYHEGKELAEQQKQALEWQLDFAKENGLPVNIHLRDAAEDFIRIIKRNRGLRGNMHAFSGSVETFREISGTGDWRIGVGGVVTFKKAGLQDVVRELPLDRIVLETDAPYLTPTPYRGTRNESSYIPLIAAKVAELKGISIEEVAQVTTNNARELFGI